MSEQNHKLQEVPSLPLSHKGCLRTRCAKHFHFIKTENFKKNVNIILKNSSQLYFQQVFVYKIKVYYFGLKVICTRFEQTAKGSIQYIFSKLLPERLLPSLFLQHSGSCRVSCLLRHYCCCFRLFLTPELVPGLCSAVGSGGCSSGLLMLRVNRGVVLLGLLLQTLLLGVP